jgi:hypothetical protein
MICKYFKGLDSGFRRNDGKWYFWTFYNGINREPRQLRFSPAILARIHNHHNQGTQYPNITFIADRKVINTSELILYPDFLRDIATPTHNIEVAISFTLFFLYTIISVNPAPMNRQTS